MSSLAEPTATIGTEVGTCPYPTCPNQNARGEIQRELAETLHAAGRLSTRVRDAIVADAGRWSE